MQELAKQSAFLHIATVTIIVIVLAISYLGVIKPIKIGASSDPQYRDLKCQFSFSLPPNYKVLEADIDNGRVVSVFPSLFQDQGDPRVVEIACEKDKNPSSSLEDLVLSIFPGKTKGNLKKIQSYKVEGFELQISNGGTTTLYSYYKANGNLYMIKFNESYYADANSTLPINNRPYLGAYYKILNSLDFNNN